MTTENPDSLLNEIQSEQDCQEFSELVSRHRTTLLRFLESKVEDKSVAEDILQGAILNAWRKFHQLRDRNLFYSWLKSIAQTLYVRHIRTIVRNQKKLLAYSEKCRLFPSLLIESGDPAKRAVKNEDIQIAWKIFRELPMKCQEVFKLHCIHGLTIVRIAEKLALHPNTIKQRLAKAWGIIQQKLASIDR